MLVVTRKKNFGQPKVNYHKYISIQVDVVVFRVEMGEVL